MTLVTPGPSIPRDRWGKPLVVPPNGGKPVAYFRCTSYIDVLDDKFNLQKWMQRMVALGLASRPDLLLSVQAHRDDKRTLDKVCEEAREAAAASAAATTGTALHALTELVDRGDTLPVLPPAAMASLDAYAQATKDLKYTHIEQFTVQDKLKIGGTPDRIGDKIYDLKTGSIEWGALKIAMQLAVYAHSVTYDVASHKRSPHGASLTEGVVIHLPAVEDATEARCDLYAVNLELGWQAVMTAVDVREKRRYKFGDLMHPLGQAKPVAEKPEVTVNSTIAAAASKTRTPAEQVAQASTRQELEALWVGFTRMGQWDDNLTALAAKRAAEVGETTGAA